MTEIIRVDPVHPDPDAIERAAHALRNGQLVAFPTETVYGLGVHALDREAVRRLFAAKQRPANDPLIVHVASIDGVEALVEAIPPVAHALATRFWPGPLTMVMRRSTRVPDEVTAGLATVAVRVPSHPIAHAILVAARIPVAAPSANLFSRPSPTQAAHVVQDLNGRIDLIVDGGATTVGVESTVIDLTGPIPTVLRPGAIDLDALRQVVPNVRSRDMRTSEHEAASSPGTLTKHYSPRAPLTLYDGERTEAIARMKSDAATIRGGGRSVTVLSFTEDATEFSGNLRIVGLGSERDPAGVAARLYAALRECDATHPDVILARTISTTHPLTEAIRDRLRRAATVVIPDVTG